MTTRLAHQRAATRLAVAGGTLGVLAGVTQTAIGSRFPDWTGNKASPVGLGLLTIVLSLGALGAASALRTPSALPASHRAAAAAGLLVPGAVCFSTVGRLWYPPGILMLAAFGSTLAAGGTYEVAAVVRRNWSRELLSLLGGFEMIMAVSARPASTLALGIIGGATLAITPWVRRRTLTTTVVVVVIATLPFAVLTWWSLASPLLALVAVGLSAAQPSERPFSAARTAQ